MEEISAVRDNLDSAALTLTKIVFKKTNTEKMHKELVSIQQKLYGILGKLSMFDNIIHKPSSTTFAVTVVVVHHSVGGQKNVQVPAFFIHASTQEEAEIKVRGIVDPFKVIDPADLSICVIAI